MSQIVIYANFPSSEEASKISKALVESRLVACANMLPAHQSVYWWDDKVETSEEVAVIFKTKAALFQAVEAKIKDLHSYDLPCIVSWPIEKGHAPFLSWINDETAEAQDVYN